MAFCPERRRVMAFDFTPAQLASLRAALNLADGTELTEETLVRRCELLRAMADVSDVEEVLGDVEQVLDDAAHRWLGLD